MKIVKSFLSKKQFSWVLILVLVGSLQGYAQNNSIAKKKILFVLTSHKQLGDTGKETGYYLGEVSHPWEVLTQAGYEIDFVSPLGGEPPVDGFNMEDPVNAKFWHDVIYRNKLQNTLIPTAVNAKEYVAIFYAGGHGTMWDFADNKEIANLARIIYEDNGIVAAVCHGPSGLLPIKLSDGSDLISGKEINSFTNEEEILVGLDKVVPFLLEDQIKERGGIFVKAAPWEESISVDQRVITGQNPNSAKAVGQAILRELQK